MRGFVLGVIFTILLLGAGGYWFVSSGKVPMAATSSPLPMEKQVAGMALRASIGSAKDQKDPLPFNDENMVAGAKTYASYCAGCHGAPGRESKIAKAMFPPPPPLFAINGMVTDDPEGETYWKITNGIRLSGMPSFGSILSDTQRWQATMLVAHADKLPGAAQAELAAKAQ